MRYRPPSLRYRPPSLLIAIGAAAAISLVVAGCGGSSSPRSTTTTSSSGERQTQAQIQQVQRAVVSFADCMRTHGVPNFPDPTTDPHAFKQAFNTSSPAFVAAVPHCQHLLPNGGRSPHADDVRSHAQIAAMLAFAGCIRSHGFARFPDPTSNGTLDYQMLAAAGIDLHQPAVIQAADSCVSVTHGVITRSMVARFVAGH